MAVFWIAGLALAMAGGCRGCDKQDDSSPAASAEVEPDRASRDQLLHRIASHQIDLTKSYPKRADGLVDCGKDKGCFVVMAERCAPALLDYERREKGMLAIKHEHALYRIAGREGEACKLQRQMLLSDVEMSKETRDALLEQGRDAEDIEAMRTEALAVLRESTLERASCTFIDSQILELALKIYEKGHIDGPIHASCHAPEPGEAWPADLMPAEPEPGATPEPAAAAAPEPAPATK